MNTKPIEDLIIDSNNPRIVSDFVGNNLANAMTKYGDLGGIVFNRKLGKLVGGNTRTQILATKLIGNNRVVYTTQYDVPDEQGTVGLGHVWHNNTPFAYREVEWDEVMHREANIAANYIHGSFVDELLAEANQFIMENNGDVFSTGQSEEDLNKLLASLGPDLETEPEPKQQKADDGMQRLSVKFTDEQFATIYQAIGMMKHDRQLTNEPNRDLDANALYYICKAYTDMAMSQNIDQHYVETNTPQNTEAQTTDTQLSAETATPVQTTNEPTVAYNITPDLTSIPTDQPLPSEQ